MTPNGIQCTWTEEPFPDLPPPIPLRYKPTGNEICNIIINQMRDYISHTMIEPDTIFLSQDEFYEFNHYFTQTFYQNYDKLVTFYGMEIIQVSKPYGIITVTKQNPWRLTHGY